MGRTSPRLESCRSRFGARARAAADLPAPILGQPLSDRAAPGRDAHAELPLPAARRGRATALPGAWIPARAGAARGIAGAAARTAFAARRPAAREQAVAGDSAQLEAGGALSPSRRDALASRGGEERVELLHRHRLGG